MLRCQAAEAENVIARAIKKNCADFNIGRPLSAVDTDTRSRFLANLKENRKGKTTILIAHRILQFKMPI